MSGLVISETALNVTSLVTSWVNYLNACTQFKNNPDSGNAKQAVIGNAQALAGAVKALSGNPLLSAGLGSIGGLTNITIDVQSYQDALRRQNVDDQMAAFTAVTNDAAGIGGGAATAIAAAASGLGDSALATQMGVIASRANEFGVAVGIVGVVNDIGTWFNTTFLPGFNKWTGNVPASQDGDMLTPMNGPDGNPAIIMAGTPGDTVTSTPLGGTAFQYTEVNSQGVATSTVTLARNGATDVEYISGQDVHSDTNGFQVSVAADSGATLNGAGNGISLRQNAQANVNGNNNYVTAMDGDSISLTGLQNIINASNGYIYGQAGDTFTVNGSGNLVTNGGNSTTTVQGDSNTLAYIGAGSAVTINGQNNSVDASGITAMGATGSSFGLNGANDVISNGNNSATFINGDNDTLVWAGANSSIRLVGTGNTLDTSSNYIYGQDGDGFTVNGSGNVITNGGNSTTTVNGSNNVLAYGGPNSSIFAQGKDNTFDTSGSFIYGQANDTYTVNGSGDWLTNGGNSTRPLTAIRTYSPMAAQTVPSSLGERTIRLTPREATSTARATTPSLSMARAT
jgi:hypothetical protein